MGTAGRKTRRRTDTEDTRSLRAPTLRRKRMALPAPPLTPAPDLSSLRLLDIPGLDSCELKTLPPELTGPDEPRAASPTPAPTRQDRPARRSRSWFVSVLAGLVAAATGTGGAALWAHQLAPQSARAAVASSPRPAPTVTRIAQAVSDGPRGSTRIDEPRLTLAELTPATTNTQRCASDTESASDPLPAVRTAVPTQPPYARRNTQQRSRRAAERTAAPQREPNTERRNAERRNAERRNAERRKAERRKAERRKAERRKAERRNAERKASPGVASKEPGYLTVAATPYATVFVDGRKLGDTPLVNVKLPAGTYRLRGVAADGRVATATLSVSAGSTVRHRLRYRDAHSEDERD